MTSSEAVTVTHIDEGYFFDGPSEDKALIFYPGAKVEETAYAPIMKSLAEQGVDCFLIKMPMKLAILGANKADDIRANYDYDNYYLAGHSLGGAMAANYASEHLNDYAGLFLLAAYPTKDLTAARLPIVFLYGDNDKVLNREKLEVGFTLAPDNYQKVEIAGSNHAQFGSYGAQDGDGTATITPKEQWQITVNTIIKKIEQ
ncbi:MAG: alpha/beta hydrolase [Eubacterium sp.]|nr:alpha/beta hydrolase [Eubacterium sp.]